MLTTEQCATLACLLEVTAPKPGNVHRGADFDDMTFLDFAASAVAIGPAMQSAHSQPVGESVFAAITATKEVTQANTNLGIVLLLTPLAACPRACVDRRQAVSQVLHRMNANDARQVYAAIRLASPGGLGQVPEMDVAGEAPDDILLAMGAAAASDLVARQYTTNFETVFEEAIPRLVQDCRDFGLSLGIVNTHVWLMSRHSDSLILRKSGPQVAESARLRAQQVVSAGAPHSESYQRALADLDFWLRSDGTRRNPGTTADLVTAALFVGLLEGSLPHLVSAKRMGSTEVRGDTL